jgi:hypothetical protein
LVGILPLELAGGLPPALLIQHQIMPNQHRVHRDHRQFQPFAPEQHGQLARSPVGPLTTQRDNARLDPRSSLARTAAKLLDSGSAQAL